MWAVAWTNNSLVAFVLLADASGLRCTGVLLVQASKGKENRVPRLSDKPGKPSPLTPGSRAHCMSLDWSHAMSVEGKTFAHAANRCSCVARLQP